ncbi:hypothetical protein O3M35_008269 [Rhynocoris fuscipes]|uniref:Uncharacterized protein n=1 Tax=Rhynocoris fuscipes TaxID=488301 RepID=A0AAW1D6D2_9HEMI
MGTAGAALFHVSALALYLYVTYFLQIENPRNTLNTNDKVVKRMSMFSVRYLTNWTYAVQTIYLAMCVVQHLLNLISANKLRDKLTTYSDYLFTSIATPMALLVSIVFWVVYIIDRELIFPRALDAVIPVYINHSIHTFNSAIAIVDMYFVRHKFPSWSKAIKGIAIYLLTYAVCVFGTYFQMGIWIYPLLKELDWPQRILFCLSTLLIGVAMYGLTKLLHMIIWGTTTNVQEKPKKQSKTKKK